MEVEDRLQIDYWVLSPMVKVLSGYSKSVIYDFKNNKAYRISRVAGDFLKKAFTPGKDKEPVTRWIEKNKLSRQIVEELYIFVSKLKQIGVLIPSSEFNKEEISEPKIDPPIPDIPTFCVLELTNRCNFHCPQCYIGPKDIAKDLALDTVFKLLEQASKMGIRLVHLTGGEVSLRKDLREIMAQAHKLGLGIAMATNGPILSEELIADIEKYVSKIQITFYGLTKNTCAKCSDDPFVLDKVIQAVDELHQRLKGKLVVNFTVTPYNYQEIDDFYRFAEERGLEYSFGRTLPVGSALRDEKILKAPWYNLIFEEKILKGIEQEKRKRGFLFRTRACPLDQITILSDGTVTLCPLLRKPSFLFGDIHHQTLKEAWYSKVKPFLTSLHVDNLEICKDCEFRYLCGGECPALWDILKPLRANQNLPCQAYFSTMEFIFSQI